MIRDQLSLSIRHYLVVAEQVNQLTSSLGNGSNVTLGRGKSRFGGTFIGISWRKDQSSVVGGLSLRFLLEKHTVRSPGHGYITTELIEPLPGWELLGNSQKSSAFAQRKLFTTLTSSYNQYLTCYKQLVDACQTPLPDGLRLRIFHQKQSSLKPFTDHMEFSGQIRLKPHLEDGSRRRYPLGYPMVDILAEKLLIPMDQILELQLL